MLLDPEIAVPSASEPGTVYFVTYVGAERPHAPHALTAWAAVATAANPEPHRPTRERVGDYLLSLADALARQPHNARLHENARWSAAPQEHADTRAVQFLHELRATPGRFVNPSAAKTSDAASRAEARGWKPVPHAANGRNGPDLIVDLLYGRSYYLLEHLGRYESVRSALYRVTGRWVGPEPHERFALPDPDIVKVFHGVGLFVRAHQSRIAGNTWLDEYRRTRRPA